VARELSIPMVAAAAIDDAADSGDLVTVDAERGIVYDDAIHDRSQ